VRLLLPVKTNIKYLAFTEEEFYSDRMAASRVEDTPMPNGDQSVALRQESSDWRVMLGRHAAAARARADLTLSAVAEQAGLSSAYISQIESGGANPTVTTLVKVAAALGIAVEELMGATANTALRNARFAPRFTPAPLVAVAASGQGVWDLTATGSSLLVTRLVRGPAGDHSQPVSHPGEEILTVLRGHCRVTVGGLNRQLNRFETCHLAASETHQITDVSDDFLLLVVLTEE
jgi:transcriptional regulator with XRE-family HTH domain